MDNLNTSNIKRSKWASDESEEDIQPQEPKKHKKKEKVKPNADSTSTIRLATLSAAPPVSAPEPTQEPPKTQAPRIPRPPSPPPNPLLSECRHVDCYERLNHIEEGSYGIVFRARDRETGDIVALKKLKLEKEKNGFPVTSLREINTLMIAKHPNIVNVREIVMGNHLNQVFIVMDFIEHDLKTLMTDMRAPFFQSEVKTLMIQLLSAVSLMHDNWIIHRDLKTSNLLLNNRGEIKVADFGLARKYGSPMGNMTQLVVTLWYRAPELLLGAKEYTTAIDMWSIGCIFAELINNEPLLPGRSEIDQIDKIFKLLGTPSEEVWPGFTNLPHAQNVAFVKQPYSNLRSRFVCMTEAGIDLMSRMLTYDPARRITAEQALKHPFFSETPYPKDPALFPTWPSKGSGEKRKVHSPSAPQGAHAGMDDEEDPGLEGTLFAGQSESTGFRLKLV
ncbi:kinase-like domain-containing protein [Phycomyces nitens]|nr:kinase-like domain-containing protein [Phycomyces nitens]